MLRGDGSYNRRHDSEMRRQELYNLLTREQISDINRQIMSQLRERVAEFITSRHPDNVASDFLEESLSSYSSRNSE
jgi:hypothetical protein